MKNLTIIIPLLENYDRTELLKAAKSVQEQTCSPSTIILAMSNKLDEEGNYMLSVKDILEEGNIEISKAINNSENQQELINYAVSTVNTKYFMVMEHNEKISGKTWLETVERYISKGYDYSTYLPLTKVADSEGNFKHYISEQWLALGFTEDEELGVITESGLKNLFELNLTGAVIDKDVFQKIGGIKTNIKYFYWYEFMLRLCYNKHYAYVIPKSLYNIPQKDFTGITREEYQFYYEIAQQEYFFPNEREINYTS